MKTYLSLLITLFLYLTNTNAQQIERVEGVEYPFVGLQKYIVQNLSLDDKSKIDNLRITHIDTVNIDGITHVPYFADRQFEDDYSGVLYDKGFMLYNTDDIINNKYYNKRIYKQYGKYRTKDELIVFSLLNNDTIKNQIEENGKQYFYVSRIHKQATDTIVHNIEYDLLYEIRVMKYEVEENMGHVPSGLERILFHKRYGVIEHMMYFQYPDQRWEPLIKVVKIEELQKKID